MGDHDLQQQQRHSTPLRIIREIDFFDEQKTCIRVLSVQETDEHLQETCQEIMFPDIIKSAMLLSLPKKRVFSSVQETSDLSFFDASTDHCYDPIKRKAIDINSFERVSGCSNPRIVRLFGVNLMVSCKDSATTRIDDHIQQISPRLSYAWTDHRYDQKKRKTTGNDPFEGVSVVYKSPRIIRFFGVNMLVSGESTSTRSDGDDDQETRCDT